MTCLRSVLVVAFLSLVSATAGAATISSVQFYDGTTLVQTYSSSAISYVGGCGLNCYEYLIDEPACGDFFDPDTDATSVIGLLDTTSAASPYVGYSSADGDSWETADDYSWTTKGSFPVHYLFEIEHAPSGGFDFYTGTEENLLKWSFGTGLNHTEYRLYFVNSIC